MKQVKSKTTGCIGELDFDSREGAFIVIYYDLNTKETVKSYYKSLEDLCEDWEDYEEPKEHWAIDQFGEPINVSGLSRLQLEKLHRLGNDFPSEKATMQAIEKLKAWKRLKNKGFKFEGIKEDYTRILQSQAPFRTGKRYLQFNKSEDEDWMKENWKDLDLLFGGEE